MKVIVDVPDRVFEKLQNDEIQFGGITSRNIFRAVKEGTPLPKGHGDLIDRNTVIEHLKGLGWISDYTLEEYNLDEDIINEIPVVISADKGE